MMPSDRGPIDAAPHAGGPPMMHVATRVSEEVFSFVGPATASMLDKGVPQLVIAFDAPATRSCLRRFAAGVDLRLVPVGGGPLAESLRLRAAVKAALHERPQIAALHLHGLVSSALGMSVIRALGVEVPVYFSPHSSRLLGPLRFVGRLMMTLFGSLGPAERARPIANLGSDFHQLESFSDAKVSLVESPVAPAYFELVRVESARPLIVAGSQVAAGDDVLDAFLSFAVLLRDSEAAPEFVWLGHLSAKQLARLKATQVRRVDPDDEPERLRLLSAAWIYMAPAGGRGVPWGLVEAMAAGLACVAAETRFHRDVLAHRRTGILYRTPAEALDGVARLIDSPAMRSSLGSAARQEASSRFDTAKFGARLERAYQPQRAVGTASPERESHPIVSR